MENQSKTATNTTNHEGGRLFTILERALDAPYSNLVTTSPFGDGKWGHADLLGNHGEWAIDWHATHTNPCVDSAVLGATSYHVVRGGSIDAGTFYLKTHFRGYTSPRYDSGARCARAP